jgi:hypothetical protein
MRTIYADFNDIEEDEFGRTWLTALTDHADGQLVPGMLIDVLDEDGNRCRGHVEAVGPNGIAVINLNLASWNISMELREGPTEPAEIWPLHPHDASEETSIAGLDSSTVLIPA